MRKYIALLLAALLLLTGCQQTIPNVNDLIPEVNDPGPPFSLCVNSVEELNRLREIVESQDEKKLQEALRDQSSTYSVESIVSFVNILDSLPVLQILDGEIIDVGYMWREERTHDSNGNLIHIQKYHEIVYITTKADDGSWVRLTYSLDNKDAPVEQILNGYDFENSLLKEPFYALNDRIFVFFERRESSQPNPGEYIDWSTIVDGIPIKVKYYVEGSQLIKAETVFQNAAIGSIA